MFLTCVVNVAVELLSVLSLEHKFALDQIFDGSLNESVVTQGHPVEVLTIGFHPTNKLLLGCWRKERFLVRYMICCTLLNGRHHVHLSHVGDYLRVIVNLLLLTICCADSPIYSDHLLGHVQFLTVLFKWIS